MHFSMEVIHLLSKSIRKHGAIELPAQGNSMFPFIQKGDICRFIPWEPSQLKKGDIVLFHSSDGRLVAHRFYHLKSENDQRYYIFKGDTNLGFDKPVIEEQIIGKLASIRKHKAQIQASKLAAYFWGQMILIFPVTSYLLRKYLNFKESTPS